MFILTYVVHFLCINIPLQFNNQEIEENIIINTKICHLIKQQFKHKQKHQLKNKRNIVSE